MQKITKTEFENWSKKIEEIYLARLKLMPDGDEKDKQRNAAASFITSMKSGNTFAFALEVLGSLEWAESPSNPYRYTKYPDLGNLTFAEWLTSIKQRIEENHKRRRNYTVNVDEILAKFIVSKNKLGGDDNYRDKVLSFVNRDDPEGREILWRTFYLVDELKKIGLTEGVGKADEEQMREAVRQFPYLFEDLVKTFEEGKKKLDDYESLINSKNHSSSGNNSSSTYSSDQEKTNSRISQLETERDNLQGEIEKVKTNQQLSEDERKVKQKELENELAARKAEIESLRRGQKIFSPGKLEGNNSKNKDNNKVNWAIGLGIAAVVIGLLCLVVLLVRRPRSDN